MGCHPVVMRGACIDLWPDPTASKCGVLHVEMAQGLFRPACMCALMVFLAS